MTTQIIEMPFVTQEQKYAYWQLSKAKIKALELENKTFIQLAIRLKKAEIENDQKEWIALHESIYKLADIRIAND